MSDFIDWGHAVAEWSQRQKRVKMSGFGDSYFSGSVDMPFGNSAITTRLERLCAVLEDKLDLTISTDGEPEQVLDRLIAVLENYSPDGNGSNGRNEKEDVYEIIAGRARPEPEMVAMSMNGLGRRVPRSAGEQASIRRQRAAGDELARMARGA